jgi:hypothetical protein
MIYHDHLPLRVAWRKTWPYFAGVAVLWMLVYHLSPLGIVALCFLLTVMVSGITERFMEIGREVSLRRKSNQRWEYVLNPTLEQVNRALQKDAAQIVDNLLSKNAFYDNSALPV